MLRAKMVCSGCGRTWDDPANSMMGRFRARPKMDCCDCGGVAVWGDTVEDYCMEVKDVEGADVGKDMQG